MTCEHDTIRQLTGGTCPICPPPVPPRIVSPGARMALDSISPKQRLAEQCRRSFSRFFREAWKHQETGQLEWAWFLDILCNHLQALVEDWAKTGDNPLFIQRFKNLLITVPPGCLKSRLLAYLIPWAWLRWPHLKAICLSCNPRVAARDSRIARDIIRLDWYQDLFHPTWEIRRDADGVELFINSIGGFRAARGLDSDIVGERADMLVIDDPHDPDQVESEVQRTSVINRYENTVDNRVNSLIYSCRVMICQKTHVEDLAEWAEQNSWLRVNLPLLFDGGEEVKDENGATVKDEDGEAVRQRRTSPLGDYDQRTEEGVCLHPERFPPSVVEELQKFPLKFATQYQQAPYSREGGIFKYSWFKFFDEQPTQFEDIVISVDCAAKKTLKGSNTAIGCFARKGPDRFVLEVWAGHISMRDTVAKIKDMRDRHSARKVVIEAKAMGPDVAEELRRDIPGIIEVEVGTDKEARAMAVQSYVEGGNVAVARGAPWVEGFLAEVCAFPAGKRDDQVDILTQVLNYFRVPSSYATKMKALGLAPKA